MIRTRKKNLIGKSLLAMFLALVVIFLTPSSAEAAPKLNKKNITLAVGKSYTLKVKGTSKKAKWKTSKKAIVKISKKKKKSVKITAVKQGKAIVSAKIGKKTYKCKVTVVDPRLSKKSLNLTVGSVYTLRVTGGNGTISWQSSRPSVASVNSTGKVTAKKVGSAKITVVLNGKKMSCTITVQKNSGSGGTGNTGNTGNGETGSGNGNNNDDSNSSKDPSGDAGDANTTKTDAEKVGLAANYTGLTKHGVFYKGEEVLATSDPTKYKSALLNDPKYTIFREQYNKYYKTGMTDAQKVYAVWNSVGHVGMSYDLAAKNYSMAEALSIKKGVCVHYMMLVEDFSILFGVESYSVHSLKRNHAWNLVKINGQFYYLDATSLKIAKNEEELSELKQYNTGSPYCEYMDVASYPTATAFTLPIHEYTFSGLPYCEMEKFNIFENSQLEKKESLLLAMYDVTRDGLYLSYYEYENGDAPVMNEGVFICK